MNPPATVDTGEAFVYVALGDSYQSGEGAAVDIRPASRYLAEGYENGDNYPDAVGAQENTYTARFDSDLDGNACHRALLNYAKLNRDQLAPGMPVLLVDRTCSGAKIEPGGKPPIVGVEGPGIAGDSQVQTAVDRLEDQGLTAADVDLVTVGMGGNDARFGDIVAACVGPSLIESLLARYPNAPGEINWVSQQATCSRVDGWFLKTGEALETLPAKQRFAQEAIAGAFPGARVMQVNYPGVLPAGDSPAWCGGLRAKDIDYAGQRITDINARIDEAAASTDTEVVDIEDSFGANALCPASSADQLAVGIDQDSFDTEVTRLLNLDGDGDPVSREMLDDLVDAYQDAKTCLAAELNPFNRQGCDVGAANDRVVAEAQELLGYLQTQQATVFGNIMSPPGTTDDSVQVAFDRSRGLFHPNAAGFEVMACEVLGQFRGDGDCVPRSAPSEPPAGGDGNPLRALFDRLLRVIVGAFAPNSTVGLTLFSEPLDLGEVTADATGVVDTEIRVPDLNPGIHRLQLEGRGAAGAQVVQEVLLEVEGRPTGSYTTYLTGFERRPAVPTPDAPIETVTVTVGGASVGEFQVDRFGGVLISVPSVEMMSSGTLTIVATSRLTGTTVSETISPISARPALWAASADDDALNIAGSRFSSRGLVHSEGGITVRGSAARFTGGVEHVGGLDVAGGSPTFEPAATQVAGEQGGPRPITVADYRPDGPLAAEATAYTAIAPAECVDGVWTPDSAESLSGVVYVPCRVELLRAGVYDATLVVEGDITVVADGVVVGRGPAAPGAPALVSGGDVTVEGSDDEVLGQTVAEGDLQVWGARTSLTCGAVADSIQIRGADVGATVEAWCLPE
ncbi:SGNH/GDSL hydrolase family protein [Ornithinimicrobium sediminis]|uniref:GDSL-type esterase/lipase family protein n=1 Tax=Ornithinimicrobium sediminis TaxID=2904603 RepID=UPI001E351CCE|nr:GDSL-type esterase/lipase family protein [Ornithinimicrobium sediminis]MCE0488296.1 GDSL-type esterase/lipase family protein [Ornithinimicrobium sediminis]